jgi:hypothetical protein
MPYVRRTTLLAITALALVSVAGYADETMRCGNALITVGMVGSQVVAKCGQPKDKNVSEAVQRARRGSRSPAVAGTSRVEHWTYDRGYGKFPALLTFESGKLKSIELLTGR